jgi:hypothetical protein
MMAQSAGERVSALIAEISMATLIVTANCRNSSPETPGMKPTGTKTDSRTRVIAMIGPGDLAHRLDRGLRGGESPCSSEVASTFSDHDDRVVHHDADEQHHAEQADGVGGVAEDERAPRRCRSG